MKRVIRTAGYCICIVLSIVFIGCTQQPIDNFKGAIVHEKQTPPVGKRYVIEVNRLGGEGTKLRDIYVSSRDWERYNVGDTIN